MPRHAAWPAGHIFVENEAPGSNQPARHLGPHFYTHARFLHARSNEIYSNTDCSIGRSDRARRVDTDEKMDTVRFRGKHWSD